MIIGIFTILSTVFVLSSNSYSFPLSSYKSFKAIKCNVFPNHPIIKKQHKLSQLSMNMFDRMFRVVTSNVNSVIKGLEDPEK
jgi:hypothetical protein